MNRICEAFAHQVAFVPQAVATATEKTSDYLSVSGFSEVEFLITTGALAAGKTLTAGIYSADDAAGTNAVKVSEKTFTVSEAMASALAVVSAKVTADRGGYYAVKFQHDADADVVCAATMSGAVHYLPADNDWKLVI